MEKYICIKTFDAEPMKLGEFFSKYAKFNNSILNGDKERDGYHVLFKSIMNGHDCKDIWIGSEEFKLSFFLPGSYSSQFNFGVAIKLLEAGMLIRRHEWSEDGLFVVKQVPRHVTEEDIPNIQSLPKAAKEALIKRIYPHMYYTDQMLLIAPDGRTSSWTPTSTDIFAKDWELVIE